jgi:hypothetical protein
MTEENTNAADILPPIQNAPWLTMATALLILFVFAGLVVGVLQYAKSMTAAPAAPTGEQQLKELRAQQRDILDNPGYDPSTKTWRIPIDQAMSILIEEGKSKGELQSFPAKPKK